MPVAGLKPSPSRKEALDGLFCECVLSLVGDRTGALREFSRVLKEGGFLIISDVFDRESPWLTAMEERPHQIQAESLFSREEPALHPAGLGFSPILWEDHSKTFREFIARLILAGVPLSDLWGCRKVRPVMTNRQKIGYFLFVARKGRGRSSREDMEGMVYG